MTNICCVGLCPLLMVAICGILTIAITGLLNGTQEELFNQYCSDMNVTNFDTGETQEVYLLAPYIEFTLPNGTQAKR